MAYVPKDAEWFLARLVEEFRVGGHKRRVVHINYILILARTPSAAYRRALQIGTRTNSSWKNPNGETVTHRLLGLAELDVIHEPLEHGCEIMFVERVGMSRAATRKLVRSRRELEAFLPIRSRPGRPDYSSKEIMDIVTKELKGRKTSEPSGPANGSQPIRSRRNRTSSAAGSRR